MSKWIAAWFFVVLSGASVANNEDTGIKTSDEAVQAAVMWLQKVDGKQLQQAYDSSGKLMRGAVTFEKWSAAVTGVRDKLGIVQARDLSNVTAHESFPGVPKGDYMVVVFKTKFAQKPDSKETLSFQREDDGQYRVIGYFVQ